MLIRFVKQKFIIDDMIVVWSSCDCCQPLKHDCYDIFPKKERMKDSHLNMMSYSSEKNIIIIFASREKKKNMFVMGDLKIRKNKKTRIASIFFVKINKFKITDTHKHA